MAADAPPAFEYRRVLQFGWTVNEGPNGIAVFAYYTPNGIRTELPLSPDNRLALCRNLFPEDPEVRKQLADELLAKSVIVTRQMPSGPNNQGH